MAETTPLRERLATMLAAPSEPAALLRQIEEIAKDPAFAAEAGIWAPALYTRNALYFEPWLLRHLDADQAPVIRGLLERAEADNYASLFAGLYRKIIDEEQWNNEMRSLATSDKADADVMRAMQLRGVPEEHIPLDEANAALIYRRNPNLFRDFVREHCLPGQNWQEGRPRAYAELRALAQAQNDNDFMWWLFRRFATPAEWTEAIRQLGRQNVAPAAIVGELQQRQLETFSNVDTSPLFDIVQRYGSEALPYIEPNLGWIGSETALRILPIISAQGDESLFRRVFFRFGEQEAWQHEIRQIVAAPLSDDALDQALQRWLPPGKRWTQKYWWLDDATALSLYRRNPQRFRAFVERTVHEPGVAFFDEAERVGDEEFLDFLTVEMLDRLSSLIGYRQARQRVIPENRLRKPMRDLLASHGSRAVARFDRLVSASPTTYVRHAAAILSHGLGLVHLLAMDIPNNPASYLVSRQRDTWRQAPDEVRDLLASPSLPVRLFGLGLLADGGADAARIVATSAVELRAILLGDAPRVVKKMALRSLESAALVDATVAARLAPMLEDMMYFRSEHDLSERVMVSFVRARYAATLTTAEKVASRV